jgi:hypothetical protein
MSLNSHATNSFDSTTKSKRVLIVTINRNYPPVSSISNGMTIVADLTGAGYPFDVVNFEWFIAMNFDDSDDHDVIFLNGHTSPVEVEKVASKCKEAIHSGRKIFINGQLPYSQYDESGKQINKISFSEELFDLKFCTSLGYGRATVPKPYEKDSHIPVKVLYLNESTPFYFKIHHRSK